ncbi:MAG: hypothetical protein M3N91_11615 [Pseudomonadota bacterium]|nr:hypothetical protein [Pseudomonadota bacterium]
MRAMILLTAAIAAAGCAGQPTNSQPQLGGGEIAATDAQRLAAARNLNLKLVDRDGQKLYCRSNYQTTSRIQRDTTCYTADQLDALQQQTDRDMDYLTKAPSVARPAALPAR